MYQMNPMNWTMLMLIFNFMMNYNMILLFWNNINYKMTNIFNSKLNKKWQ
nr:ATP synthase F0 subunit 8 [Dipterophagus daci]QZO77415.1 ATP synthase F0 subunit 8 [Dipterophagus daci]